MASLAHNVCYVINGARGRKVQDCWSNWGCAEARPGGVLYYWIQMLSLFLIMLRRCSTV